MNNFFIWRIIKFKLCFIYIYKIIWKVGDSWSWYYWDKFTILKTVNNKVLLVGGAGYIGSMLATKLVYNHYNVTVVDIQRYSSSSLNHLYSYKNFTFINSFAELIIKIPSGPHDKL